MQAQRKHSRRDVADAPMDLSQDIGGVILMCVRILAFFSRNDELHSHSIAYIAFQQGTVRVERR
jgi:hypothetical protein